MDAAEWTWRCRGKREGRKEEIKERRKERLISSRAYFRERKYEIGGRELHRGHFVNFSKILSISSLNLFLAVNDKSTRHRSDRNRDLQPGMEKVLSK